MNAFARHRLPILGGAVLVLVAGLVVAADSGLLDGGPRREVLVVDHAGEAGGWRRVREQGRYVSSILAEQLDPARYTEPFRVELIEDAAGTPHLLVTGRMVEGSAAAFTSVLDEHAGDFDTIAFDTAGFGLIDEGMAIGRIIRERQLKTVVREGDVCGGIGCMAAFVGGVERAVADLPYIGGGRFGLVDDDQMPGSEAARAAQGGVAETLAYFREMGVDPSIVEPMLAAERGADYRFSAAELRRANVAHRIVG